MPIERQTAKKVRILDLMEGQWVKNEGMEPSFVVTKSGQKIGRAHIMATIVGKFVAEDGQFASITLDDATDTIRAKTFKTTKPIESFEIGQMVDVVGKVREWNDEIYIIPEIVQAVDNPNMELLRRLEIMKLAKNAPKEENKPADGEKTDEKDKIRKDALKAMEDAQDGISFSEILEKTGYPEEKLEPVVSELLAEGICYEPSPGKIKKI